MALNKDKNFLPITKSEKRMFSNSVLLRKHDFAYLECIVALLLKKCDYLKEYNTPYIHTRRRFFPTKLC